MQGFIERMLTLKTTGLFLFLFSKSAPSIKRKGGGAMEFFKTFDANLATFLQLHKLNVALKKQNGRVFFIFQKTEELDALVSSYHSGATVDLAQFLDVLKALKGKMFGLRDGGPAR
jgi:Domain of unknown function (DUF5659)